MPVLAYIVTGHGQKAPGYWDPGATSGTFQEARSVRAIAPHLDRRLQRLGVDVVVDDDGYYHERHARLLPLVGDYDRVAVIHLHHNSSASASPCYGAVMWDARSAGGQALSLSIGEQLAGVPGAPWGHDIREIATYDDRGKVPRPWLHRAYGCIDEVYSMPGHVSASLLELGFASNPRTRDWFRSGDGAVRSAEAIAIGTARWLKS